MRENDCCAKAPNRLYDGGAVCCESERPEPMMGGEYPSRSKAREINIQPMNYGFVVRVGCQTFVFETAEKMMTNLNSYLADPDAIERAWFNGNLTL
jgi:hypothetical protein